MNFLVTAIFFISILMSTLEEKYLISHQGQPQPEHKKPRIPIRLEDGTVVTVNDSQEVQELDEGNYMTEEQQEKEHELEQERTKERYDFGNRQAIREQLAQTCNGLLSNPSDKQLINKLFGLVESFDNFLSSQGSEAKNNAEYKGIQEDIDTSLEILLRNVKDEAGPLGALKGLYNSHVDRKLMGLIELCLAGHQNAVDTLAQKIKFDQQFTLRAKLVTLLLELVNRQILIEQRKATKGKGAHKRPAIIRSPIVMDLFVGQKVSNIHDLVPKFTPRKALVRKNINRENREERADRIDTETDLQTNQQTFVSNLVILATKVTRELPRSALVPGALKVFKMYGPTLNESVFLDMISVVKMYFYSWYTRQPNFNALLSLLGEEEDAVFSLRVNKQYRVQQDFSSIH